MRLGRLLVVALGAVTIMSCTGDSSREGVEGDPASAAQQALEAATSTPVDATPSPTVPPTATPTPTAAPTDDAAARVVAVTDGDTLDIELADGTMETVRLIGINAPERTECWADEATEVLAALVEGQAVELESDQTDRDRFGRLLRYLTTSDGVFVNERLVEMGAALSQAYSPDTARQDALDAAMTAAQTDRSGLWATDACGPAVDAAIEIVEINENPPGDDNDVLNEEWISLRNASDEPLDLTGWSVRDESSTHRFTFPDGYVLGPGQTLKLRSGCGAPTPTDVYWCSTTTAIWNNGGDTIFVLDPSGNIRANQGYGR